MDGVREVKVEVKIPKPLPFIINPPPNTDVVSVIGDVLYTNPLLYTEALPSDSTLPLTIDDELVVDDAGEIETIGRDAATLVVKLS